MAELSAVQSVVEEIGAFQYSEIKPADATNRDLSKVEHYLPNLADPSIYQIGEDSARSFRQYLTDSDTVLALVKYLLVLRFEKE